MKKIHHSIFHTSHFPTGRILMAFSGLSVFPAHMSECVLREATHTLPIPAPEHRAAFLSTTHKHGMPATPTGGPRLESQTRRFHQRVKGHRAAMFYTGSGTGLLFYSVVPLLFRLHVYWKWKRTKYFNCEEDRPQQGILCWLVRGGHVVPAMHICGIRMSRPAW